MSARGFTLVETLFVVAIVGTLSAIAIPRALAGLDDLEAGNAARYLAQELGGARMQSIKRSTFVGLRFLPSGSDYAVALVEDGDGNGIRTADLVRGVDRTLAGPDVLGHHFHGVVFGLLPGVPDADGKQTTSLDGVRVGSARILSMNPNGSSTSGTLYLHGERTQYAVRVLGITGRVRVLKFDQVKHQWNSQ